MEPSWWRPIYQSILSFFSRSHRATVWLRTFGRWTMGSFVFTPKSASTIDRQTSEMQLDSCKRTTQQLLPGVPDDITLEHICTKLPWQNCKILSLVSLAWQKALNDRQVYSARVRNHATETLIVHNHGSDPRIGLYSTADDCCYELPPIPQLNDKIPSLCECIGLNGKIYVLGGGMRRGSYVRATAKVFVWDVAGRGEWKQCASMQNPRQEFGCGIGGGKIYVFGGRTHEEMVRGSEVYDPEVNGGCPIEPMPSWRCCDFVATVGEELFAFAGFSLPRDWDARAHGDPDLMASDENDHQSLLTRSLLYGSSSFLVYCLSTNKWRVVENSLLKSGDLNDSKFMVEGEFYCMSDVGLDVFDVDKDSWIKRNTNSFSEAGLPENYDYTNRALAVDNELFALGTHSDVSSLIRSRGFDSGKEEIWWHKIKCPGPSRESEIMYSIKV